MEFCGIICEFNPFHNGHKYLIEQAKQITKKEILCLMSGQFVQRGFPAIEDKYERAKKAIDNGANVVLELPTIFACSNAENFASGAIRILSKLNVTHLAFGIEDTSLEILQKIAMLKTENLKRFKNAFKNEIQNGISYNTALKRSIAKQFGDENIIEILNKPNNILAVEYLSAIIKQRANIIPVAINRIDNGFYSDISKDKFLSATSIRNFLNEGKSVDKFIPKNAKIESFFDKNSEKQLNMLQLLTIRLMSPTALSKYYDYSEGIEYRIKTLTNKSGDFENILKDITTPRYREPRVRKLLLYPILNIKADIVKKAYHSKPVCKVLAMCKNDKSLLKSYNKNKISLITNNKDYAGISYIQRKIIEIDLLASNIYATIQKGQNNQDKKIGTLFL